MSLLPPPPGVEQLGGPPPLRTIGLPSSADIMDPAVSNAVSISALPVGAASMEMNPATTTTGAQENQTVVVDVVEGGESTETVTGAVGSSATDTTGGDQRNKNGLPKAATATLSSSSTVVTTAGANEKTTNAPPTSTKKEVRDNLVACAFAIAAVILIFPVTIIAFLAYMLLDGKADFEACVNYVAMGFGCVFAFATCPLWFPVLALYICCCSGASQEKNVGNGAAAVARTAAAGADSSTTSGIQVELSVKNKSATTATGNGSFARSSAGSTAQQPPQMNFQTLSDPVAARSVAGRTIKTLASSRRMENQSTTGGRGGSAGGKTSVGAPKRSMSFVERTSSSQAIITKGLQKGAKLVASRSSSIVMYTEVD
ncbi:unnamed protein product [Amoebophrya sp. A25]|nr:unnamed protein product [Amoebophrya sp. A25]|eukprot:GSA25T00002682001.1